MEDSKIIYSQTLEITKSNSLTIQISNYKGKDLLNIFKSAFSERYTGIVKNNSLAFSLDQIGNIREIIESISGNNEIEEYGQVGKYKIFTSTYKGNNSFQIREWVESESYTGYGKRGISIAMNHFDAFKVALYEVLDMGEKYLQGELQVEDTQAGNENEIESYF